jgi:Domain of unknown function (DUF4365)
VARGRKTDGGKRRTREHIIADLAINHIERHALLCGHTLQRTVHDYGLDALLTTFNRRGEAENGLVWMQVKATDHPDRLKAQDALTVRVERKHLLFWMGELFPVFVVIYDATRDRAHWLHVQEEFGGGKLFEAARVGTRLTLRVPRAQVLDRDAIGEFRRRKLQAQTRFEKGGQ